MLAVKTFIMKIKESNYNTLRAFNSFPILQNPFNMKRLSVFLLLFLPLLTIAQIYDPVKWNQHVVKTGDDTYEVVYEATIEPWVVDIYAIPRKR